MNALFMYPIIHFDPQKLEENDDDSYLDSPWANPRGLKNQLSGAGGGVRWKLN